MRNMKRCNLDEPDAESGAYLLRKSKILKTDGRCSVEERSFSGSFCGSNVSELGSEVDFSSEKLNCQKELKGSTRRSTAPLLTYSRNRYNKLLPGSNDTVARISDDAQAKGSSASTIEDANHTVDDKEPPGTGRGCMAQVNEENGRINCGMVRKRETSSRQEDDSHLRIENVEALTEVKGRCTAFNNVDFRRQINYRSSLICSVNSSSSIDSSGCVPSFIHKGTEPWRKGDVEKKKEIYRPEDFAVGDILWAKCGKKYPAWPAIVIDPWVNAPDLVLRCCVPGALCVMFFGYSKNGTQRVR